MMVRFKGNSRFLALGCKNSLTIFCYTFCTEFGMEIIQYNILGETVKRLCKDHGIEGQFTNHSLRATTATRGLQKGFPDKLVMERTGHRDVRSLQKYQRPETSIKIAISKKFDSCESVSTRVRLLLTRCQSRGR